MKMFVICIIVLGVIQLPTVSSKICYENTEAMISQMFWKGLRSFQNVNKNCKLKDVGGATYIQWGKSTCTNKNADLVYSGYVGGPYYNTKGAASNRLCLPKTPQWGLHDNKVNKNPSIGATVFEIHDLHVPNTLFDKKYTHYRVECSVCYIKHGSSTMMIPGRQECFGDWKKEYTGYLFASYPSHVPSDYICMDGKPDHKKKTSNSWAGLAILYSVQAQCSEALPCPPYVNGKEMTCVVCSK